MRYLAILFISLITVSQSFAQKTELSLNQAIQLALQNNFDIRLSEIGQTIAETKNTRGNAGFLPHIIIQDNLLRQYTNTVNPLAFAAGKLNMVTNGSSIQGDWILFSGFRAKATKKILDYTVGRSKLEANMIIEGTVQSVILTYYNAQLQKQQITTLANQLSYSDSKKELAERQFSQGVIDKFEYYTIAKNYWADSVSVLNASLAHQQLIYDLKKICIIDDSTQITLTEQLPAQFKQYDFNELVQQIQRNNSRLQLENTYLHIKSAQIEQSKSFQYPTLILNGYSSLTLADIDHDIVGTASANEKNIYLGLTLNFDLWKGGQIQNKIKTSKLDFERQQVRVQQVQFDLYSKLQKTLNAYEELIKILDVKKQRLQASEELMKIAQERYNHGIIDGRVWQQIKVSYLQAQSDCLLTIFKIAQQESELIRMSGGILKQ